MKSSSGHSGNDGECSQTLECCDGQSAGASEVVAVGVCRALEQSEHAQAAQLSRQPGRREVGQKAQQVASCQAVDVERRALDRTHESLIVAIEEVQALEGSIAVRLGVRDALECALATAVVIQAGEELKIALIAAEQDLAQVDQAEE